MVLEVLVNPKKASGKKWEIFIIGAVYSLLGFILSYWVFRSYAGIVMVTFASLASVPFVRSVIQLDQEKEKLLDGLPLLRHHSKTIEVFTLLFLGYVFVFSLLYALLPQATAMQIFTVQNQAIESVRHAVTGAFTSFATLGKIIVNNMSVLFFCLLFSLLYGMGAIFILSWNASVMGAAVGAAVQAGTSITNFLHALAYFVHGIPEIISYFVAALAGGILSFALMKEGFNSFLFKKTAKDATYLLLISIGILLVAGLVEVFLSPLLL